MKRQDPIPVASPPEHDGELPEGWVSIELGDHVYIAGRIGWRGLKANEYTQDGPVFLSVPNLNFGDLVSFAEVNHISHERYDESPEIQVQAGDTLLVKDGAGIGKIGYIAKLPSPATVNSSLLVVRPNDDLLASKYLFYYLKGPQFQQIASERITGSATPHLFQKDIRLFRVLVPPLAEQARIVAKVESLLERVNAARERLARVPAILKRFRQSVLAAACSGQLTAEWRHSQAVDGRQAIESILLSIARRRSQSEISALLAHDLEELPSGWVWTLFGQVIGQLRNGISAKPQFTPPGIAVLRISAVRPGLVDLDTERYLPDAAALLPEYQLRDRDLLFTRYNGSLDLLGVCGMVRSLAGREILYPDKLMRVRFDHPYVLPEYVECYFQSPCARERLTAKSKSSAGQQGISGADVKAQPIALPPLDEQHEIVRRVEALFKLADAIEKRVAAATARAEKMTQAILAKAFRGELVPTEAELARREGRGYEPASVLLDRIRAERADTGKASTPRTRKPRRSTHTEPAAPEPAPDLLAAEPTAEYRAARPATAATQLSMFDDEEPDATGAPRASRAPRASAKPSSSPTNPSSTTRASRAPRASAKPTPSESSAPAQPYVPLSEQADDATLMHAIRDHFASTGAQDRDQAIHALAQHFGYARTGSRIREELDNAIRRAVRRGILNNEGGLLSLLARSIDDYSLDHLVAMFLVAVRGAGWVTRDDAMRATANLLGFQRLGPNIKEALKSAINAAIRRGQIVSRSPDLIRSV